MVSFETNWIYKNLLATHFLAIIRHKKQSNHKEIINNLKKDYIREKYKAIKYKLGFYLYV